MKSRSGPSGARPLVIGLLNNMPDAALEATERQFEDLLGSERSSEASAPAPICATDTSTSTACQTPDWMD
jgi:hypothetical protein